MRWNVRLAAVLAALCLAHPTARAAEAWQEYDKIINGRQTIAALGPTLFGDNVNLATGGLSFATTDVSIPGNSALPVAVTRTFAVKSKAGFPDPDRTIDDGHFGDWEMDLPNISGTYATATGWANGRSDRALLRCSVANTTEAASPNVTVGTTSFRSHMIWHGNRINIPGKGSAAMLVANANTPRPSTGGPYYWATSDWTALSCLPSIQNGTGEGFLATTADGTRYWFNHMSAASAAHLRQKRISTSGFDELTRKRYALYATRVEDRFGNWVSYTYNNAAGTPARLASIDSSDGRRITLAYAGERVASVSDGAQTWRYEYLGTSLTGVVLPDSSRWTMSFAQLGGVLGYLTGEPGEQWRDCNNPGDVRPSVNPRVGTITHPSGATGEFTLDVARFRRSGVPEMCSTGDQNTTNDDVSWYPNIWDGLVLARKRLTGVGLTTADWTYTYEGGGATTSVVGPDNFTRYSFGTTFRVDEGKLLQTSVGSGPASILRTEVQTYQVATSGQPYPTPIADSPQIRSDDFTDEYPRPQLSHTISQQGVTFKSQVNEPFDSFARALSVTKSSTLGYSKVDTTEYADHLSKWVLGQIKKTTTAGIVTSETYYDPSTALPLWSKAFGNLQQTLTYNLAAGTQAGTIATVKDGRNLVTTLSNWYRGIPRSIQHADTTTQSAVVNATGWITQVTDENGFQTNYTYDVMGRMASIVYPAADTVAWNTTTQAFAQVASSEYGIPAGHWRQTISTGNGRKQTYFDALWRPVVTREHDAGNVTATQRFTRRAYDAGGRESFVSYPGTTDALTMGTRTTYDALDRVTSVAQDSELGPLTTSTAYLAGFQTRTTNPRGKSTLTTIYQAYDEPNYELPRSINHPEGAFTEIFRDVFGKPTAVKRRNLDDSITATRRYVYGTDQQLCKVIEPETGATVTDYDAAGNLAWTASGLASLTSTTACNLTEGYNSGRRADRTYDARNRVSSLSFPNGLGDTSYSYTPDGQPASITVQNGGSDQVTTNYIYNKRGMPTSENMQWGGLNWFIYYAYDANGSLASKKSNNLIVNYSPNALGQATRAGTFATGVTYFPNGAIKQFTYGNGIVHTLTQNARQLPDTSLDAYGTTAVLKDGYDYDFNGNVAAISDGLAGARGNRTMTYDGLDRLKTTVSPMYTAAGAAYTYDALDNIKTLIAPYRRHTYFYDVNNRLTNVTKTVDGATVTGLGYDVQGNLAQKNGDAFVFDYGNRLRSVTSPTSTTTYIYDGHGRRVGDITGGAKYSLYSMTGELTFVRDMRVGKRYDYVNLAGSLVAIRTQDIASGIHSTTYQHTDALGTPVAVTDASRKEIERSEYEPYGKRLASSTPAVKDGIGYTGHVEDAATGMTYMQQRYYDPGIGRFLSVDPVTADGNTGDNFNRYWYANNNPYRFVDPDGRCSTGTRICMTEGRLKIELASLNEASEKIAHTDEGKAAKHFASNARHLTEKSGREIGANMEQRSEEDFRNVDWHHGTKDGVDVWNYSGNFRWNAIMHTHPTAVGISSRMSGVGAFAKDGKFFRVSTVEEHDVAESFRRNVNGILVTPASIRKFDVRAWKEAARKAAPGAVTYAGSFEDEL